MRIGLRLGRIAAGLLLCTAPALVASCASPPGPAPKPDLHAAPRGYIAFCTREPQFCDGHGPTRVKLTAARWGDLLRANDAVNDRLKPQTDKVPADVADDWEVPTGAVAADCEDYVLAKKLQLLTRGWPGPALRIGVVEPAPGRRHAVLLADTDAGVFVLDNLSRKVLRWTEAGYRFVLVQVSTEPDRWEAVTTQASLSGTQP